MRGIHLDHDRTGSNSIQHLMPDYITSYPCPTLQESVQILAAIERGVIKGDFIIADTITRLTSMARDDVVVDPSKFKIENLWAMRGALKSSRDDFYSTMSLINRYLRAIYDLQMPSILVAHERVRNDPLSGIDKFVPDLQEAINGTIFTSCDFIARLCARPIPFDYAGYQVPAGTRLLITSPTGDSSAGGRSIPTHPIPPMLVGWQPYTPTFGDLVKSLGYMPHNTVIYGPAKIGKTTLAASLIYL